MLGWLAQFMAPPMEPELSPEETAQASLTALQRRARIELERAERLATYARKWPSADDRPTNIRRFYREFRG